MRNVIVGMMVGDSPKALRNNVVDIEFSRRSDCSQVSAVLCEAAFESQIG
ncbi:MAG: hypothetical protein V3R51_04185 [Gammaproteobacteria bacterium]